MKSNPSFLFLIVLLFLLLGCTSTYQQSSILTQESRYQTPDLPKSELATIQIDTDWIHHNSLFALAINKKVAVRGKIRENNNEIYVVPGSHEMALLLINETHSGKEQQSASCLSIEVKADTTYLLTAEYENDTEDNLCFQLTDTTTQEVVSQPQTENNTTFDYKNFQDYSFQSENTWHF